MKCTLDTIPDFDLAGITDLGDGRVADFNPADIRLTVNTNHTQKIVQRRNIELTAEADAVAQIGELPHAGEALHLRMDGSFNGIELVIALAQMAGPAEELVIATLSYNRRVCERLIDLLDAGKVKRILLVVSAMFQGKERHHVEWMAEQLAARGSVQIVARNHQKLALVKTSTRHLVTEGSQNLRTCRCYEQAVLTDDAALYRWHQSFLEGLADARTAA